MSNTREHWDQVYAAKTVTEVSWYQPRSERSLALIKFAKLNLAASILDVGGGTSLLVDDLLTEGYSDLTVLDVSEVALRHSKERLGPRASHVSWIVADITEWHPTRTWDVWHDRAAHSHTHFPDAHHRHQH